MKVGESEMDYNSRTLQSIVFDQAARYFKHTKAYTDTTDDKEIAELATKVGYVLNIAAGIHKSFKQEKRIKLLESKMKDYSINTSMFEEAPLKEYR